jgi:hypothetical protein
MPNYDAEFMRQIAGKGGRACGARHGPEFFKRIGAMGGHARKGKPNKKKKYLQPKAAPPAIDVFATLDDIIARLDG